MSRENAPRSVDAPRAYLDDPYSEGHPHSRTLSWTTARTYRHTGLAAGLSPCVHKCALSRNTVTVGTGCFAPGVHSEVHAEIRSAT